MKFGYLIAGVLICSTTGLAAEQHIPSMEETYAKREIPAWFNEAKFGIFVVWGPYSVPGFAVRGSYAEWYLKTYDTPGRGGHKETVAFHNRAFGPEVTYEDFADQLTAEMWDPDFWCRLFADSGAKYVVTTANYHDGFAMYPTKYGMFKKETDWNAMERGPKRDIIGELNRSGEKYDLKMGIYFSVYEWYHPLWIAGEKERYAKEWFQPKFKEVVKKYKPWHIFLDGEWNGRYDRWGSDRLAHWLYTESPVKDYVVTNDRWGHCRGKFGDVFESEYGAGKYTSPHHPWQEDRGIGRSYGYNRNESVYDYDSREELIRTFSGVVGGGGNFLLCVGPTGDGRIPVIMQERLLQVGEWLEVNGDAVYGTTASPFWPRKFDWGTVSKKPGKLYLHVHDPELGHIVLHGFSGHVKQAKLLHKDGPKEVNVKAAGADLSFTWKNSFNDTAVTVIELDVEEGYAVDRTPRQFASGSVEFDIWSMTLHGEQAYPNYEGINNRLYMHDWRNPEEYLTGEFVLIEPGKYKVELIYASRAAEGGKTLSEHTGAVFDPNANTTVGGRFTLTLGEQSLALSIEDVGNKLRPQYMPAGMVEFAAAGKKTFMLKPDASRRWNGFMFQGVRLTPVK
ncbi:alpha-L-fucosidase [Verrucomicrobia bacterium S94]|nr:alpha-L-fucosidase [Verrucomicrobia bacterium S94]